MRIYKSKEIILPLLVAILLTIVPIWMIYNYYGKYFHYQNLSENGVLKKARLTNNEIKINDNGSFNESILPMNDAINKLDCYIWFNRINPRDLIIKIHIPKSKKKFRLRIRVQYYTLFKLSDA